MYKYWSTLYQVQYAMYDNLNTGSLYRYQYFLVPCIYGVHVLWSLEYSSTPVQLYMHTPTTKLYSEDSSTITANRAIL
jgi:hypothetical protein